MTVIKEILNGWANLIKDTFNELDAEAKNLSESRLSICNNCDIRLGNICNPSKVGKHVDGSIRRGCGCNIAAKSMSKKSRCPLGKW